MRKYDFEKMGGIWKNEARTITEKGVFVATSGNGDLWEYSRMVYSGLVPDYWQSVNYDFLGGLGVL